MLFITYSTTVTTLAGWQVAYPACRNLLQLSQKLLFWETNPTWSNSRKASQITRISAIAERLCDIVQHAMPVQIL